jgi:hypothetical protein
MRSRTATGAVLLVLLLVVVHTGAVTPGRITVYSTPSFATVCIDTVQCDITPANFGVSGNAWHTVNLTESGYQPWSESIYVLTDQTSLVDATLLPDSGITGIQVFVQPGGGTVCLDNLLCHAGIGSGGSTGSTIFPDPGEGYHLITVNNTPGYLPYSTRPYVTRRGFVTLHADLDPVPTPATPLPSGSPGGVPAPTVPGLTPGRITVWSDPSFAVACIDNDQCDTTPANFGVSGNAWHTVNVTGSGYQPWSDWIYVLTDQTSLVNATLRPDNGITGIQVYTRPGGGTVCLDGSVCHTRIGSAGGTGVTEFTGLGEGYHFISVNATEGYLPYSTRAYVTRRGFVMLYITLDPIPARIDPNTSLPVVTTGGFATIPRQPDLIPATSAPPTGAVRVSVNQAGSTICIDNRDCREHVGGAAGPGRGTTVFTDVIAGIPHTINVTAEGYRLSSNQVTVGAGKVSTLNISLMPVTGTESTVAVATTDPEPRASSAGLDLVPVVGALALCTVVFYARRER